MGGMCCVDKPENKFLSDGYKPPEKEKPEEEIFDIE